MYVLLYDLILDDFKLFLNINKWLKMILKNLFNIIYKWFKKKFIGFLDDFIIF